MIDLSLDQLHRDIAALRPEYERMLAEIVEIPTVSMDPAYRPDIRRGAEWAKALLAAHGGEATIVETAGFPVVVGMFRHPEAKRTLTIYNHLDVQPANEPEWTSEPFRFTQEGDTYRGRGTTDDKGPALAAFYAAMLARKHGIALNIRFVWEFEEEIGSPNFEAFLEEHAAELATDSVLVSDTIWISRDKPASPLGLRGMVGFRLLLETGTKDVHSGLTGGAARNPIGELCQLISEIYDARTGNVKIPGFYDRVMPVTPEEELSFLASGFETSEFQRAHGLKCLRVTDPLEVMKRIWARPTFEVHGMVGGYTGPGVKAIVPPRAEAKVSMRLVPDMKPAEVLAMVKAFVAERNPDVVLDPEGALEPYIGAMDGPYSEAIRTALRFGFGANPAFIREGGSIGAVVSMQKHLGCPIMFIGLSLPEHGYHAPNENFDWSMAEGGMKAFMRYFEQVAAL
jgi:acetylornithine deacetylase/succinyl-diaminopimelate desuccinylase-like protein